MTLPSRPAVFVASLIATGAGFAGNAHAMSSRKSADKDDASNVSGTFGLEEGWLFAFDANASMDPSELTTADSGWMQVPVPQHGKPWRGIRVMLAWGGTNLSSRATRMGEISSSESNSKQLPILRMFL